MIRLLFTFVFVFVTSFLFSQGKLIKRVDVNNVKQVAIDRAGDIYTVTASSLIKYDKDGKIQSSISIEQIPTSFDTGNGVRLLMYQRSNQSYTILSPSLQKINAAQIENSVAIEPWLVCSSGDYNILIVDAADWSIKKVDTRDAQVIHEFIIDSELLGNSSFTYLREYQNFIFLLDEKNRLTIFNTIGIKLKTYEIGDQNFNFLGQELYYIKNQKVHLIDLFTSEIRVLDLPERYENILITDERMIGINTDHLDFLVYNSQ